MPTGWADLRLDRKLDVFHGVARKSGPPVFPEVLAGRRSLFVGIEKELVTLSRGTLAVENRIPVNDMTPACEWNDDLLFMAGVGNIGMLDQNLGRLLWTKETTFGRQRWGEVLVLGQEAHLSIVDAMNGRQTGTITVAGPGHSTFLVSGDTAVLKAPDKGDPVCAVKLSENLLLWKRELLEEIRSRYGIDDNLPILNLTQSSFDDRFIGARGGGVFAFSLDDGHILWKVDVPIPYYFPLVVDGRLPILVSERFVVIDEISGELIADTRHQELRSMTFRGKGTSYGDTVAFVSESGHIALFNMTDGSLLWTEKYPVSFYDSAEADGRLLVTASDGRLWVFSEKD